MRFSLIIVTVFSISCSGPTQSTLQKVKALDLNLIEGTINTYYPAGYEDRAIANLSLLNNSIEFFEEHFEVEQTFSIAVIDSANWGKITSIPYGLPYVSGPPYIVCFPASSNNVLSNTIEAVINGYDMGSKYELTNKELVNLFVSLIGFHELGHIYANAYGASFPNKWTYEFAATYFAYFYLDQNFTRERDIWIDVSNIIINEIQPRYTSLKDFESKYSGVGIKNYAWYQVAFLLQVEKLYTKQGKTFLNNLRSHKWSSTSTTEYIDEMDEIGSGFTSWAQLYKLQ